LMSEALELHFQASGSFLRAASNPTLAISVALRMNGKQRG